MEFFRHCPGCGRRFHIKLESKKLVDVERMSRPTMDVTNIMGGAVMTSAAPPLSVLGPFEECLQILPQQRSTLAPRTLPLSTSSVLAQRGGTFTSFLMVQC